MVNFAHWLSIFSKWLGIAVFFILSLIFFLKNKCLSRMLFFCGVLMIAIGTLIQICSPVAKITFDEFGKVLSTTSIQISWYEGSVITSFGIILAIAGFAWIVFKK